MRPATLLALALLTGCFLEPRYCGVESREADVRAQISAPGVARIERMDVYVIQSQSDRSALSLHWRLAGVDLQYHVQTLRIMEGATGIVLVELATYPVEMSGSIPSLQLGDRRAADRLYEMILHNETAVEILTDIPGRERIAQTLEYQSGSAWGRPVCD